MSRDNGRNRVDYWARESMEHDDAQAGLEPIDSRSLPSLQSRTTSGLGCRVQNPVELQGWLERVTMLADGLREEGKPKWAPPAMTALEIKRKRNLWGMTRDGRHYAKHHRRHHHGHRSDDYFPGSDLASRPESRGSRPGTRELRPDTPLGEDGLPVGVCEASARKVFDDEDPLEYHSGVKGRRHFFDIAKNIHARPADAAQVQQWLDADTVMDDDGTRLSKVEGAASRGFLGFLMNRSLPPRPILSRIDLAEKELDVSGAGIRDEFGTALVQALPQLPGLEKLNVSDNDLTDATIEPLLDHLLELKQLQVLDLSHNDMDVGGARALRELVASSHCPLTSLVLKHTDIDDDDCRLLCEAISENGDTKLEELCLCDNLIGSQEGRNLCIPDYVTGGEALGNAIRENSTLLKLDLSWNAIRNASAVAVGAALEFNSTLVELNLEYNSLGDYGCEMLGGALEHNASLTILKLAQNSVRQKGSFVLGNCIRYRTFTLEFLSFMGNHPSAFGSRALLHAVRDKRGDFLIDMNGCSTHATTDVTDFFDVSEPKGTYKLSMAEPYERSVARELLRIATFRNGCSLSYLAWSPQLDTRGAKPTEIKLSRKEISADTDRETLWKPIITDILKTGEFPKSKMAKVLDRCHLHPSPETLTHIKEFVDQNLMYYTGKWDESPIKHHRDQKTRVNILEKLTGKRISNVVKPKRLKAAAQKVRASAMLSAKDLVAFDNKNAYHRQHGKGKLTHEVMFDMIFRGTFRLVDIDESGSLCAAEVAECGQLLGTSMDEAEAARVILAHDHDGDATLAESEFVLYMMSLFLSAPGGAKSPLLDGDGKVWTVPKDGYLHATLDVDPGADHAAEEIGCDAGVRGLLALIHSAATDQEKMKLFTCATAPGGSGGYFTNIQAQEIIDVCSETARLDVYVMCRRLVFCMATGDDCCKLLVHNLTEGQQLALRCDLGHVAWRIATDRLTGHYAFDLGRDDDRELLKKLIAKSAAQQLALQQAKCADVSQTGNWGGLFRNVRLDREPYTGKLPLQLERLPEKGVISFDCVSMNRPKKMDKPLVANRFQGLLNFLRAHEWKTGADPQKKQNTKLLKKKKQKALEKQKRAATMNVNVLKRAASAVARAPTLAETGKASSLPSLSGSAKNLTGQKPDESQNYDPVYPSRRGVTLLKLDTCVTSAIELVESSPCGFRTVELELTDVVPDAIKDNEEASAEAAPKKQSIKPKPGSLSAKEPVVVKAPKARYVRLNKDCAAGVGTVFDTEEAADLHVPPREPLAWMWIKLIELEVRASRCFFTAQQVSVLWFLMPEGELWAEFRVALLGIVFRCIVDLENLKHNLLDEISRKDKHRIRHRLGILNTFNPRHCDGFYRLHLSNYDERVVAKIMARIAGAEEGDQWKQEFYRRSDNVLGQDWFPGWELPVTWLDPDPKDPDDLNVPKVGNLHIVFTTPTRALYHIRDQFLPEVTCGFKAPESSGIRITATGYHLRR